MFMMVSLYILYDIQYIYAESDWDGRPHVRAGKGAIYCVMQYAADPVTHRWPPGPRSHLLMIDDDVQRERGPPPPLGPGFCFSLSHFGFPQRRPPTLS